jgi:YD repeat-containing protein
VNLIGGSVHADLKRIELEVSVAGQTLSKIFPAAPSQQFTFEWDGLDAYGRLLQGAQPATIRIGYVYPAFYYEPGAFGRAFASYSSTPGTTLTADQARSEIAIEQTWIRWLSPAGSYDSRPAGLGGWTLNVHHFYDPRSRTLHLGDGGKRTTGAISGVIDTVAGGGATSCTSAADCDGLKGTDAGLNFPFSAVPAPDGAIFIADTHHQLVWKLDKEGVLQQFAGGGNPMTVVDLGDGGPANQTVLGSVFGIALARDGSLYIGDVNNHRLRKVAPSGVITTVAGTGDAGSAGNGGPALAIAMSPYRVAVAPDGTAYFVEFQEHRVWRLTCDGMVQPVAGTGVAGFSGDGGAALSAELQNVLDVDVGPDGSLYILDDATSAARVRRVGPDGIINTVAGSGLFPPTSLHVGEEATKADLFNVRGIGVGPDGTLYIASFQNQRILSVEPDGKLRVIAGSGAEIGVVGFGGDGGPALAAKVAPGDVAIGADGKLVIADSTNDRIRVVKDVFPGFSGSSLLVPSADGSELYAFTGEGRHLSTRHSLLGSTLYSFGYDAEGRLTKVTDVDGLVTTIDHDSSGNPTQITAPFGQKTALGVGADGYLASVFDPASQTVSMTYAAGGLLSSFKNARGFSSSFTYDALGRLTKDADPPEAGGCPLQGRS